VYSRSTYRADRYVLWVPLRAPRRPLTPRAGRTSSDLTAEPATTEVVG